MVSLNRRNVVGGAAALGALAAGNGASAFWAPAPPKGTWTQRGDMPFAVQEIYPTAFWQYDSNGMKPKHGGILVNAGGMVSESVNVNRVTDRTVFYTPGTEWWGDLAPLPQPRHHLAVCFHGRSLYAVGGFYSDSPDARRQWQMQTNVWRLDSLSQPQWFGLMPLPIPNAEGAVVSVGERIHVMGGRAPYGTANFASGDHIDTDRHWMYIEEENRWIDRAPLLSPRNSMAAVPFDETVYLIGGRRVGGGNLSLNEVYVPSVNRWQKVRDLPKSSHKGAPAGRSGFAGAVWKRKIYVFGGEWWIDEDDNGVYSDVFEYDPRQDKWRSVGIMPRPRHGLGAVALDDGIFVVGGASAANDLGVTAFVDKFVI